MGSTWGWLKREQKTVYALSGKRDGTHLTLDMTLAAKPEASVGKIEADIDGIADMVGTITLGKVETPFQAAQHSRVPPPAFATPGPNPSPTRPY